MEYFCPKCNASCRMNDHECVVNLCEFCDKRLATVALYDSPSAHECACEECAERLAEGEHEDRVWLTDRGMRHGMRSFTGGKP